MHDITRTFIPGIVSHICDNYNLQKIYILTILISHLVGTIMVRRFHILIVLGCWIRIKQMKYHCLYFSELFNNELNCVSQTIA